MAAAPVLQRRLQQCPCRGKLQPLPPDAENAEQSEGDGSQPGPGESEAPTDAESESPHGSDTEPTEESEVSKLLTDLVPTSPEILRATRAAVPLEWLGLVLRQGIEGRLARGLSDDRHSRSFATTHFDEFWSHSWHGPAWQKVVTLLVFYNSPAAIVASFAAAAASASLQFWAPSSRREAAGLLSFFPAFLGVFVTLALWRPSRRIFLDSVCISQSDKALKQKGIMSLGGFLRHSKSMIILWDTSYSSRVWCVFEQAAFYFLQKKMPSKQIYVRPTFQVTAWMVVMLLICIRVTVFLLMCTLTGVPIIYLHAISFGTLVLITANGMRRVARDLAGLSKQIESFDMEHAKCFCCSHNHCHPDTSEELLCDRLLVEASVKQWFGSLEHFVQFVRGEMKERFRVQCDTPPYRIAVLWSIPLLWITLGMAARLLSLGHRVGALEVVLANIYSCFFVIPMSAEACWRLAWYFREKSSNRVVDRGKDILLALIACAIHEPIWSLYEITAHRPWHSPMIAAVGTGFGLLTLLAYRQRLCY